MRFEEAKEAIIWAFAATGVGMDPTQPLVDCSSKGNGWAIVDGLEKGEIQAAIGALREPAESWAMWVYTDDGTPGDEMAILDYVIDVLDAGTVVKVRSLADAKRVQHMVLLMMFDVQSVEGSGVAKFSKLAIAERVGVSRSEFSPSRYWGRLYRVIDEALFGLNAEVLKPVERLLKNKLKKNVA